MSDQPLGGAPPPPSSPQQPGWGPPPPPPPPPGWGPPPPRHDPMPQGSKPPRKKPRVFMWVILAVNALFLVLLITAMATASSCTGMTGDELSACQAGEGIGEGIAVFLIVL